MKQQNTAGEKYMSEKPITDYDELEDEKKYDRIYLTDECGEITWCKDKIGPGDELYINAELIKGVLDTISDSGDEDNNEKVIMSINACVVEKD